MTVKEEVLSVVDSLPDAATIEDVMEALYIAAKFDKGDEEIEAGHGISHEEALVKLSKWLV